MFLQPGSVPEQSQLYRGQGTIQLVLIMAAAVCVPWLLIAKPYLLWKEMHRNHDQGYVSLDRDDSTAYDIPHTAGLRLEEEDGPQIPGARLSEEEGRALIQTDDEEAVRFMRLIYYVGPLIDLIPGAS